MKQLLLTICIQLISFSSVAGNIANVFSEDIFGAKWGSSKEEVEEIIPGGKSDDEFGIVSYTVKDGRALFDIERNKKNYIRFTFDAQNRLIGTSIEFPLKSAGDFGFLLSKLNTTFGEGVSVPNSLGVTMVEWPEDKGLKISLSHIPGTFSIGELLFAIEYKATPVEASKEELGF